MKRSAERQPGFELRHQNQDQDCQDFDQDRNRTQEPTHYQNQKPKVLPTLQVVQQRGQLNHPHQHHSQHPQHHNVQHHNPPHHPPQHAYHQQQQQAASRELPRPEHSLPKCPGVAIDRSKPNSMEHNSNTAPQKPYNSSRIQTSQFMKRNEELLVAQRQDSYESYTSSMGNEAEVYEDCVTDIGGIEALQEREQRERDECDQEMQGDGQEYGQYGDFYPEGEESESDSKWIFDSDKGWVANPAVSSRSSPTPSHHGTVHGSQHAGSVKTSSLSNQTTMSFGGQTNQLMAAHEGKGLGAKISAVLGGDVVTVVGSQTGNEPLDNGNVPPPPPAPEPSSFTRSRSPGNAIKRSSPVTQAMHPMNRAKVHPSDSRQGSPSSSRRRQLPPNQVKKKELWKNSTKSKSMMWQTTEDEEFGDEYNKYGLEDETPSSYHTPEESMDTFESGFPGAGRKASTQIEIQAQSQSQKANLKGTAASAAAGAPGGRSLPTIPSSSVQPTPLPLPPSSSSQPSVFNQNTNQNQIQNQNQLQKTGLPQQAMQAQSQSQSLPQSQQQPQHSTFNTQSPPSSSQQQQANIPQHQQQNQQQPLPPLSQQQQQQPNQHVTPQPQLQPQPQLANQLQNVQTQQPQQQQSQAAFPSSTSTLQSSSQPQPPSALRSDIKRDAEPKTVRNVTFSDERRASAAFHANANAGDPMYDTGQVPVTTMSGGLATTALTTTNGMMGPGHEQQQHMSTAGQGLPATFGGGVQSNASLPSSTTNAGSDNNGGVPAVPLTEEQQMELELLRAEEMFSYEDMLEEEEQLSAVALPTTTVSVDDTFGLESRQSTVTGVESVGDSGKSGVIAYAPTDCEGLSTSRILWISAFNKIITQWNEVSNGKLFLLLLAIDWIWARFAS